MKILRIYKIQDDCLSGTRYELHLNGSFYTSNISKQAKDRYVNKFKDLGYTILKGCSDSLSVIL